MTDTREPGWTVLDEMAEADPPLIRTQLLRLGIDPYMPFEDLARWLRYGKNVDEAFLWDADHVDTAYYNGWTDCLDEMKGDD